MENPNRNGILALGNLLVDRTLVISDYPQESMLATISDMALHCGGGCTNILFNLAKLDPSLPLYLSGAVGHDAEGRFILKHCQTHNINIDAVSEVSLPTSFTDVMINSQNGERTFFHYVGAMGMYGKEQILQIDNRAKIAHIAYLPLLPALLAEETLFEVFRALNQKGFQISIDLVSVNNKDIFTRYIRPILPYTDFVIINDIEAKILTDQENISSKKESLEMLTRQILHMGVKNSVIVHCPDWASASALSGETVSVASRRVAKQDIVSTLGAGDAFCTGALYGFHQQMPLVEVLQLGHTLAYFNLFSVSATDGAVSYQQAKEFLEENQTVN